MADDCSQITGNEMWLKTLEVGHKAKGVAGPVDQFASAALASH